MNFGGKLSVIMFEYSGSDTGFEHDRSSYALPDFWRRTLLAACNHCGRAAHAQLHRNPATESFSRLDDGGLVHRASDGDLFGAVLRPLLLSSRMVETGVEPTSPTS